MHGSYCGGPRKLDRWISESVQGQGGSGCGEVGGDSGAAGRLVRSPPGSESWKKALTEGAVRVFGNSQDRKAKNDAALTARLYQEIGQLKVERDFLAKRSGP